MVYCYGGKGRCSVRYILKEVGFLVWVWGGGFCSSGLDYWVYGGFRVEKEV